MIDLHSHTLFSDGDLLPAELARRAEAAGYRALAFTDHVDASCIETVVRGLVTAAAELQPFYKMRLLPGVEITHCPPGQIGDLVRAARSLGAGIVLVHGETLAEPVKPGTNHAAILAGADVIAHPGLISAQDAALAAKRGVCLEISARAGHSLSNGHVAAIARKTGVRLVFGTDTHDPENICPREKAESIARGAGLTARETGLLFKRAARFFGGVA
jgi:histidinol phosphatase-like PHP family hydrolase